MRNLGLQFIKLISLIRYYQFIPGLKIFIDLLFVRNKFYIINSAVFANKIYLRPDQSDPFIFEQIFCEQQYNYNQPNEASIKWIIDAGANIGLAAIYFSKKYPNAKIISLEPDSENFKLLKKNTLNYPNVICLNVALWHKEEDLAIANIEEKSAGYIMESLTSKSSHTIKSKTIIGIMKEYKIDTISILKIDIEGSEKELFQFNSHEWIPHCNTIITELHDWLKEGTSKIFFKEMSFYNWLTYVKGENIICLKSNEEN